MSCPDLTKWLRTWVAYQLANPVIVPFQKDFSSSGEQLEHRKLAHEL